MPTLPRRQRLTRGYIGRAGVRLRTGDAAGARADLREARRTAPEIWTRKRQALTVAAHVPGLAQVVRVADRARRREPGPMKILLVTIDFPLPVNAGGVVRLLGISEALVRRGHEVHMLAKLRRSRHRSGARRRALASGSAARRSRCSAPATSRRPAGAAKSRRPLGATRSATRTPPWVWTAYSRTLAARATRARAASSTSA